MLIDDVTGVWVQRGYANICGVDEAGRGPLAGPVCAAAVILKEGAAIDGVNDSKKLTEKKREALFDVITGAAAWHVAFASVEEIEERNILRAALLAMRRAIDGLSVPPGIALIDGNQAVAGLTCPVVTVTGGDGRCVSIAAASVLAKVSRDRLMAEYDAAYPEYGFARHKGYGTKAHIDAIRAHGLCAIHRRSFIKEAWLRG